MNPPQSWDHPRSPYLASPRRRQKFRDREGLAQVTAGQRPVGSRCSQAAPLAVSSCLHSHIISVLTERLAVVSGHRPRHCRYQSSHLEVEAEACVSRYLQSILPLIKAENGSHIIVRLEAGKGVKPSGSVFKSYSASLAGTCIKGRNLSGSVSTFGSENSCFFQ